MAIQDRDRKEWAFHPVTLEFLAGLQERKKSILEGWANGNYTVESIDGTVQLNSNWLGRVQEATETIEAIEGLKQLEITPEGVERVE